LLTFLVLFENDGGRAGMPVTMLVEERDLAGVKADAAVVWLKTVLLEVPPGVAELANPDEGAGLDAMSFL
jgi:hypothetical protein